jgi:hypothetical protein
MERDGATISMRELMTVPLMAVPLMVGAADERDS